MAWNINSVKKIVSEKIDNELNTSNALKYIESYLSLYFNKKFKRTGIKVTLKKESIELPPPNHIMMRNAFNPLNNVPLEGQSKETFVIKIKLKNDKKDKISLYPVYGKYKYNNGEIRNIKENESIQEMILRLFELMDTTKNRTKLYREQQNLGYYITNVEDKYKENSKKITDIRG